MRALLVLSVGMSSTGNSLSYICNTCNIYQFKFLNTNVSKQLVKQIVRKPILFLILIKIKENPSHIHELINYLCIELSLSLN